MGPQPGDVLKQVRWPFAIMGLLGFLCVLLGLGSPGITCDEPLDVRAGRHYLEHKDALGRLYGGLITGTASERDATLLFGWNAQHPPLGRWLVGGSSALFEPFAIWLGGADPYSVRAGRVAPAFLFGALLAVLGISVCRYSGAVAGFAAASMLLGMPRLFAHAHFATLDMQITFFWTWGLFAGLAALRENRHWAWPMLAGGLWGLALLTKIQAWSLPLLLVPWAFSQQSTWRALRSLSLWLATGWLVFLVGWPWLWFETWNHLWAYLATSVERAPLKVLYFGSLFLDHELPWHYPWVFFLATVPLGFHLLSMLGLWLAAKHRRESPAPLVWAGSVLLWLVIFSTGVAVYDGERLFLHVFPCWAALGGIGFDRLWRLASRRIARLALVALAFTQFAPVVGTFPLGLSYYNMIVGGLPGAQRLGLELTYWGDSLDGSFLEQVAQIAQPGQIIALCPTLHHMQPTAITTPALLARGVTLKEESYASQADWVIVYRREAYLNRALLDRIHSSPPALRRSLQNVWLSGLWKGPISKSNDRIEIVSSANTILSE